MYTGQRSRTTITRTERENGVRFSSCSGTLNVLCAESGVQNTGRALNLQRRVLFSSLISPSLANLLALLLLLYSYVVAAWLAYTAGIQSPSEFPRPPSARSFRHLRLLVIKLISSSRFSLSQAFALPRSPADPPSRVSLPHINPQFACSSSDILTTSFHKLGAVASPAGPRLRAPRFAAISDHQSEFAIATACVDLEDHALAKNRREGGRALCNGRQVLPHAR